MIFLLHYCRRLWLLLGRLFRRGNVFIRVAVLLCLTGLLFSIICAVDQVPTVDSAAIALSSLNKHLAMKSMSSHGGYRKSGQTFENVSAVVQAFASPSGVSGFLNYRLPSDKGASHDYNDYYDVMLAPYVRKGRVNVLEFGVKIGGSLMLWRELFHPQARIYGVDIDTDVPMFEKDPRIKVLAGVSSMDPDLPRRFSGTKFDVIVDDGSHLARHQAMTLQLYWATLKSAGVYIIEDVANDCYLLRNLFDMVQLTDQKDHYFADQGDLASIARILNGTSVKEKLWITIHEDKSGERLFVLYPAGSLAREHVPPKVRCAMGGAPGPPCEEVMASCRDDILRSP